MKFDHDSGDGRPLRNSITLVLPTPEKLEEFSDELPASVVEVLKAVARHKTSDIADISQLIPEEFLVPSLSSGFVPLTQPKEIAYDEYFSVGRVVDRPRLCLALAFLRSVRSAALNASLGHDLEPASVADLLKSIRVTADILMGLGAEPAVDEPWPKGTWPNGPW